MDCPEQPVADGGVFDSSSTFEHFFVVPARIYVLVEASWWIRFREFWAPATAAASGGGSTSGASSSSTSGSDGSHSHQMFAGANPALATPVRSGYLARTAGGSDHKVDIGVTAVLSGEDLYTRGAAAAHDHGMAHTHSTPNHGHGLTYGIFKEAMPGSIDVDMGLWRKPFEGGSWDLLGSVSGLDEPEQFVDLTTLFDDEDPHALYRLTFQSAPAQPNGGRLAVDVVGTIIGAIQSE
jgi:hypothetical protein